MNTINDWWYKFADRWLKAKASRLDWDDARKAFYAGSAATLKYLADVADSAYRGGDDVKLQVDFHIGELVQEHDESQREMEGERLGGK